MQCRAKVRRQRFVFVTNSVICLHVVCFSYTQKVRKRLSDWDRSRTARVPARKHSDTIGSWYMDVR